VHQSSQSAEWQRGAGDTRGAVYSVIPVFLAAYVLALIVMAVLPFRRKPTI
jgi:hypothetical protein